MIRSFRGISPRVASSAYLDRSAEVVGDVTIGERSSIWFNVSIRGDVNSIRIGDETSIQDNSVLHVDHGDQFKLEIGNRVTVGHRVVLHGCAIEDEALIGIGAIVLNGARIGKGSVVAAGTLVPEGMEVPPNSVVMGVPGKVRRAVTTEERERFRVNVENYITTTRLYKEEQA
jgi:carbonic anhydrase/acetyltransferase-like protein (isoleucine patch superfamily)